MSARAALGLLALAGCASFEDPVLVRDLRVLAMRAEPPEQVLDIDPAAPVSTAVLDQLQATTIRALIADPAQQRPLRWAMTACLLDDDGRCDLTQPHVELGRAQIEDPDAAAAAQQPTALLAVDDPQVRATLAAMFARAIEANPVQALGGIEYAVELRVGDLAGAPADDVVAIKRLRVAPRIPQARQANQNPRIDGVEGLRGTVQGPVLVDLRCATAPRGLPPVVAPGTVFTLYPREPADARETYQTLTLDGQAVQFTETIEYQWITSQGGFSDAYTGGARDLLGNVGELGSDWRAPQDVTAPLRVSVWGIQRDERYGVSWFETCIEVVP